MACWSSCCGFEASERATWTPCWLQTRINKASLNISAIKRASGSLHAESILRSAESKPNVQDDLSDQYMDPDENDKNFAKVEKI